MKIKICGVCRPEDAALIAKAGAHYIGVILAARGPRQQTVERATRIFEHAGGLARVGVFADQPVSTILSATETLNLDVVQLHGAESAGFVADVQRHFDGQVWKTIAVRTTEDLQYGIAEYAEVAHGLLLDHGVGGSGHRFDWKLAHSARETMPVSVALIVAGGLNPQNVSAAIQELEPDIVDVASGVEHKVGEKSRELVDAFVRNAKS